MSLSIPKDSVSDIASVIVAYHGIPRKPPFLKFEHGDRLPRLEVVERGYPGTSRNMFGTQEVTVLMEQLMKKLE